jgi:hypothetical protein
MQYIQIFIEHVQLRAGQSAPQNRLGPSIQGLMSRAVGPSDQGKLQGILTVDFGKLAGWNGLTGFVNVFQIHNTGRIRRDYVGGLNTIAAIEAVQARLSRFEPTSDIARFNALPANGPQLMNLSVSKPH